MTPDMTPDTVPCAVGAAAVHGGPDALGVPQHDFSTNSNACGPCPVALQALQQADATTYPDPGYHALRAALAAWHGVVPERVVVAGSASEFIHRITAWVAQRHAHRGEAEGRPSVWLPAHHYGDYAAAAQTWGLQPATEVALADLAWACDPASPLGGPQPGLAAWAQAVAAGAGVLDRAYEPLRLQGALSLSPPQLDRLWQLWTPNKALGLTGVRGAYVIAPVDQIQAAAALARLCPSWPLGAHGVALLQAWVDPRSQAWLRETLPTLRDWAARQRGVCQALGWQVLASQANFFCCDTGLAPAALARALVALRGHGIKLRDAASFGLPGHVRLGVLPPASQDALAQAWPQVAAGVTAGVTAEVAADLASDQPAGASA